jgi:hypothetical protein
MTDELWLPNYMKTFEDTSMNEDFMKMQFYESQDFLKKDTL